MSTWVYPDRPDQRSTLLLFRIPALFHVPLATPGPVKSAGAMGGPPCTAGAPLVPHNAPGAAAQWRLLLHNLNQRVGGRRARAKVYIY